MGTIRFTANLQRHLPCPEQPLHGSTLREALDWVFERTPRLRSYLLDEHGRLRRHVTIYINDRPLCDRATLSDALAANDEVFVFQALSGG